MIILFIILIPFYYDVEDSQERSSTHRVDAPIPKISGSLKISEQIQHRFASSRVNKMQTIVIRHWPWIIQRVKTSTCCAPENSLSLERTFPHSLSLVLSSPQKRTGGRRSRVNKSKSVAAVIAKASFVSDRTVLSRWGTRVHVCVCMCACACARVYVTQCARDQSLSVSLRFRVR